MGIILICLGPNWLYELVNDLYIFPLTTKIALILYDEGKKVCCASFL